MSAYYEAVLWEDAYISDRTGDAKLLRGIYMVTVLVDEIGGKDGARLTRIDIADQHDIQLSQSQFELLDGLQYFEKQQGNPRAG